VRILANDFGQNHGYTLFDNGTIKSWEVFYNTNGHTNFWNDLVNLLTPGTLFLGERFLHLHEFANRPKIDLMAPEYIGVARMYLDRYRIQHKWQNAAQACGATAFYGDNKKGEGGNQKIQKLGLWIPGKRHAMDSLRHLLYYQTFTLGDPEGYLERLR
jgi:hypothetical protein